MSAGPRPARLGELGGVTPADARAVTLGELRGVAPADARAVPFGELRGVTPTEARPIRLGQDRRTAAETLQRGPVSGDGRNRGADRESGGNCEDGLHGVSPFLS